MRYSSVMHRVVEKIVRLVPNPPPDCLGVERALSHAPTLTTLRLFFSGATRSAVVTPKGNQIGSWSTCGELVGFMQQQVVSRIRHHM